MENMENSQIVILTYDHMGVSENGPPGSYDHWVLGYHGYPIFRQTHILTINTSKRYLYNFTGTPNLCLVPVFEFVGLLKCYSRIIWVCLKMGYTPNEIAI